MNSSLVIYKERQNQELLFRTTSLPNIINKIVDHFLRCDVVPRGQRDTIIVKEIEKEKKRKIVSCIMLT